MAKTRNDPLDLEFMGEVDAALRYRGSRWAYRLSFILLFSFCFFMVWLWFTERDEVTKGTGQITPSLGVQPIQSEQGGVIKEIFVKEGQEVKKGDRLAQMVNTDVLAEAQDLRNKQIETRLALKRLDAEIFGTPLTFSDAETVANPEMVLDQMRLYQARKEKLEGGTRELQANLEQKKLAVEESLSRRAQFQESLLLLKETEVRVLPLVRAGTYPEMEYLNLRQRIISQEGELNALAETIARTQGEVREVEEQLANRGNEWQATIASERNEHRRQLDSINQRLTAGTHMVELSDLRSPMNGVIRRILLKEDNPAQRAETIMELLPTDDTLEVDARFKPADRGFLEESMNATVKIDAYDFTIYGALPAIVTRISANTIEDSKGQAWYEVRLQTEASRLHFGNQELEIKPGMTVQVDVISGRKSLFDYLLKPILKSRQTGMARGHAVNATQDSAPSPAEAPAKPDGAIPIDPYALPPAAMPPETTPKPLPPEMMMPETLPADNMTPQMMTPETLTPETMPQADPAKTDETLPAENFSGSAASPAEPDPAASAVQPQRPSWREEADQDKVPDATAAPLESGTPDIGSMLPGVGDAQEARTESGAEVPLPDAADQTGTMPPNAAAPADSASGESQ